MAFQIQYPPQTPTGVESFLKGYQGVSQGKLANQQRELAVLEGQVKQKEIDNYDKMIAAELGQIFAQTQASQASTAESQARTKEMPLNAQFERWLLSQQAMSAQAEAQKRMFEAENPELGFSGPTGEIAKREYLRSKGMLGTPQVSGQASEESQQYSPEFTKVLESQEPRVQKIIKSKIIPQDEEGLYNYNLNKSLKESSMSPTDLLLAESKAKEEAKNLTKLNEERYLNATATSEIDYLVDRMEVAYEDLPATQRGWIGGKAPAWSTQAQIIDNSAKYILEELMQKMIGRGVLSERDVANAEATIANRSMNPEAFEDSIAMMRMLNERGKEHERFMADAIGVQGLSSSDAKQLWSTYILKNPMKYESLDALMKRAEGMSDEEIRGGK